MSNAESPAASSEILDEFISTINDLIQEQSTQGTKADEIDIDDLIDPAIVSTWNRITIKDPENPPVDQSRDQQTRFKYERY